MAVKLTLVSPLEKCFADTAPVGGYTQASALQNETVSFQVSIVLQPQEAEKNKSLKIRWELDTPGKARVRIVRQVPVLLPTFADADDDYLRKSSGLFPDVLEDISPCLTLKPNIYVTLWIDIQGAEAGMHPVTFRLFDAHERSPLAEAVFKLTVLPFDLPKQTLIHTKWLHCDCLCQYYGVEMWSEQFWKICEQYVAVMAKRGINMLLTPIHTPPLDTAIGGERMTCQLVDISIENGRFSFAFSKLKRWVKMAERCGIEYFEMAHLFTQWGAKHAPKIIVRENSVEKICFGWQTDAHSTAYLSFLQEYLTALRAELRKLGIENRCYFHLSDEPDQSMLDSYRAAYESVSDVLRGMPIIDALSEICFYRNGLIKRPVVAINAIEPFLQENVPNLWAYYCLGQYIDVPNLFVAMSGTRTRVLGVLLYKFHIEGFLQWGFNFYNAQDSTHPINPWVNTDCDGFTPAGDAFQVYPGSDGKPVESQRLMLIAEAMDDLRALNGLESLIGRDKVMQLLEKDIEPLTFTCYPRNADWLIAMRERINQAYAKYAEI